MKRKRRTIHPLEFATRMVGDGSKEYLKDLKRCEETFRKAIPRLKREGWIKEDEEYKRLARASFHLADWLKYKQVYRPEKELAEDLFAMDDLSFPLASLHLPFPVIYVDFSDLEMPEIRGTHPLGVFLSIREVPYGENCTVSCCSLLTLGYGTDYVFGGITFDYEEEKSLEAVVERLTREFPEERVLLRNALLFAAYLSSAEPDISENETQKSWYRPSPKPKASSVRSWDVGVRYMQEKKKAQQQVRTEHSFGKTHQPPRPHVRKAHWHTYRVGAGRKERKVLWIPPVLVGVKGEMPVTVRSASEKLKL